MHGQDGPGHDASQGWVSAARRFGKPAEDVEDVRLRSRLYSATSRPALLTYPGLRDARHAARDRHLVRGASAIGRDRLTTEERLSDIVEILAHGLLWLDVLRDFHGSIRSHNFRRFLTEGGLISFGIDQAALYRLPAALTSAYDVPANLEIAEMASGTVKWFNSQKGYGFIQPTGGSGGRDVFVHISAVERAGLSSLNEGQHVEYEIEDNRGKSSAVNLKVK